MPDCNGHGHCVSGKCQCVRGYKGKFCEEGKFTFLYFLFFFIQVSARFTFHEFVVFFFRQCKYLIRKYLKHSCYQPTLASLYLFALYAFLKTIISVNYASATGYDGRELPGNWK